MCFTLGVASCLRRNFAARAYASSTASHITNGTLSTPTPVDINPKRAGTIMDVFSTSDTDEAPPLPARFAQIKKDICKDPEAMTRGWKRVLKELEVTTEEIAKKGGEMIPYVSFDDVRNGLKGEQLEAVKKAGVVVVRGAVPEDEALAWKQSIKDYIKANEGKVIGGPPGRIVFYEIYNSPAQIQARTHPSLIATQKALLSLWHSSSPDALMNRPISYFDRLRIRPPGPSAFTLGPHIDGGSIERWEDPGYRKCFQKIFEGGMYDPFDVDPRLGAKQDLYHAPNQCSVFRPFQGWLSLSHTRAGEGTLRVLPSLSLATAYIMLRPFFHSRGSPTSLNPDDWTLDLESTAFPGSAMGKTQEPREHTHPHLQLAKTMVSVPEVRPGDQVYWHCDLVHSVESEHNGPGDSSVLYIPAVPLTPSNAQYLRRQAETFRRGLPPPDFPGGVGESEFVGRITEADVKDTEARRMLGLDLS